MAHSVIMLRMRNFLFGLPIGIRYLIAGGTSTAIDLGILFALTEYVGWHYLVSATAAFCVAVVVSFVLQKFYTFGDRSASGKAVATQSAFYLGLQITNIGINAAFMYALVEWAGLWYFFAQIIAAATIAVGSFFVYRFVIFHPRSPLAHWAVLMRSFFVSHRAVLVVALAVSLLYGIHHLLMPSFMPGGLVYTPVTYASDPDAGGYYGPRANAFFARGELELPSLLPVLNPLIMGGLGKALLSMERAYIVSDFLIPPLIFLAVYALLREVFRRAKPALLLASVFMVSPLAALLSPSVSILPQNALLYFSSFEYPKITFIFYTIALLFIFRALRTGVRRDVVFGGVFFGILFYTYLYDWAYLTVALVLAILWFVFRRNWRAVKSGAGIFGIGGIISIPYWFNFAALRRLPHYEDLMFRIAGVEIGRHFRFGSVWKTYARHLVWIGALIYASRKHLSSAAVFLISLLAAYFVVVNVQLVLGFSPQPDHWYRETFLPVMLAFGVVVVWLWKRYLASRVSARTVRIYAVAFLVLFFAHAFYGQYRLSRDEAHTRGIPIPEANAYQWLNEHTPSGSMVASERAHTNYALRLFTENRSFVTDGFSTLASQEELWELAYAFGALWGLSEDEFRVWVSRDALYLFKEFYRPRTFDGFFSKMPPPIIPEEELTLRVSEYAMRIRAGEVIPIADYVFVEPRGLFSRADAYTLMYEQDGFRIYEKP